MAEFKISDLPYSIQKKISVDENTGCWLWTTGKNRHGYGVVCWKAKTQSAHRFVYYFLQGEIPKGLELDHLCRVRECVNPKHLEPVTGIINNLRSNSWSGLNSRKTHCGRGHPFKKENTYLVRGERVCRECSRERVCKYRLRLKGEKECLSKNLLRV